MWRVVVAPRPHEENATTLLSSELMGPSAPVNHHPTATGNVHQQHHPHWTHPHHHPHYPLSLPPPPPTMQQQQQHAYHHGQQQQQQQQQQHEQQQNQQAQSQDSVNEQSHQQRSLKRPLSDSDCDDVFSEESGKEPCNSPGDDSCQHTSRKRRRGMIEKKRRDRINASLGELRRLVPAAARDPHSGKLEKAEILQLTVEHLRTLRNKGAEGYDSTKLAMDYHAVGWGECAAEVGRYLVTMEGLDERDPLRLRLLSHLQSFHRDSQSSTASQAPPATAAQQQPPPPTPHAASTYDQQAAAASSTSNPPPPALAWPPAQYPGQYPTQYGQHQQHGKPYRPWGAELNAY